MENPSNKPAFLNRHPTKPPFINRHNSGAVYNDVLDYAEIFGGGTTRGRSRLATSIPVLDLPPADVAGLPIRFPGRHFDYSEVFGGSDARDFALFEELKGAAAAYDSSDEAWTPAQSEALSDESEPFSCADMYQSMSNAEIHLSSDGIKQFKVSYNKVFHQNEDDVANGVAHVTHLNDVPGYSFLVDETLPLQKMVVTNNLQHEDFGGLLGEGKRLRKTTSCDYKPFVTISDISLKTQPSHLPPPSRPPPIFGPKDRDFNTPSSKIKASRSFAFGETNSTGNSPLFYDVEVDASTSAAVSAAEMKDVMEKAEAKLKSAKNRKERNKQASERDLNGVKGCVDNVTKHGKKSSKNEGNVEWKQDEEFYEVVEIDDERNSFAVGDDQRVVVDNSRNNGDRQEVRENQTISQQEEVNRKKKCDDEIREKIIVEAIEDDDFENMAEVRNNVTEDERRCKNFERQGCDTSLKEAMERAQNENRLKESLERVEKDMKEREAWEREEKEMREKDAREREFKEKMVREAIEKEENEKRLRLVLEEKEKKQREAWEREEKEKREKEAREKELEEKRLREAIEKEENEKRLRLVLEEKEKKQREAWEREEKEKREKEAREKELEEKRLREAIEKEENEKILRLALEEKERKQREAREREEKEEREKEARQREEKEKRDKEARERDVEEKRLKKALEEEEEKKQREACDREEKEKREKEARERELAHKLLKETIEQEDNEKRKKLALENEENEKTQKITHVGDEAEKRLTDDHSWQNIEEQPNSILRKEDSKEKVKEGCELEKDTQKVREVHEREVYENRSKEAFDHEEIDKMWEEDYRLDESVPFCGAASKANKNSGESKKTEGPFSVVDTGIEVQVGDLNSSSVARDNLQHKKSEKIVGECKDSLQMHDTVFEFDQKPSKRNGNIANPKKVQVGKDKKGEKLMSSEQRKNAERKGKSLDDVFNREEKERKERMKRERELENERLRKVEEEREREREREKDRMAVDMASLERATAGARQRAVAEARERLEKVNAEAKLRAERAAVERATAEARERAFQKAKAGKATVETREQTLRSDSCQGVVGSTNGTMNAYSSVHGGVEVESAERCKARQERLQRTAQRAAKALEEKNMRDLLAQRELAERNRLAEGLDAEVKRWSSGKEGNLRALLSTLQYILGPDSGWQPLHLTEIITSVAVKRAYRRATLWVHPDKLQQRGASIHEKYVCEKVFDLLKAAWNKFNSEER